MVDEFSGVTIVTLMAGGILTLTLLFIFVKRQIMRFALRSKRGPHVPIGHDARKTFRREIERRIEVIPKIMYEPKLLPDDNPKYILPSSENNMYPSGLYCRQKAVDDIKRLEKEIAKSDRTLARHPSENLRAYLMNTLTAPPNTVSQRTIHQFCDLYEQARYDPNEFTEEEYRVYSRILLKLLDAAKMLKAYNNVRKPSPNRLQTKKSGHVPKESADYLNEDMRKQTSITNPEETPV